MANKKTTKKTTNKKTRKITNKKNKKITNKKTMKGGFFNLLSIKVVCYDR